MANLGNNTTANLTDIVRAMLASARFTMEHDPVMKSLVVLNRIPRGQGGSYKEPKWGTLPDAHDMTEGVDNVQVQQMSDSLMTLTPTEVGHSLVVTDRLIETATENVMRAKGKLMGDALQRKIDKDGLAMLDGFSTSLVGAGNPVTWEHISAAETRISGGTEPAPASSPRFGVFHPYQLHILAKDFAPAGTYPIPTGMSQDIMARGRKALKQIADVTIYADGNLSIDSSDDAKGGVFAKDALRLVWDEPYEKVDVSGSLRGQKITQGVWYIYGEFVDAWGVEINADSVAPSS